MIELKGITWDHPRGFVGLERATAEFSLRSPARIHWARQSLQRFESSPIADLAEAFDLIVLDHPCVGDAWQAKCLVDLEEYADELELSELARSCVGRGVDLYRYGGGLWALPLDGACQVAAYRHDLLAAQGDAPPRTVRELKHLTRDGKRLVVAFGGVHGFMTFLTLCAALGSPVVELSGRGIVPEAAGLRALALMQDLRAMCPPEALDWASIDTLNAMSERDDLVYCPFVFGFAAYSDDGFAAQHHRAALTFTDIPGIDSDGAGAVIGGTGLAVSRRCSSVETAVSFLAFVLADDTQKMMARSLGQPARRSAWQDGEVNRRFRNFYRNTLPTIDRGYLRPRYPGYVKAQHEAGQVVERFLRDDSAPGETLARLNEVLGGGVQ